MCKIKYYLLLGKTIHKFFLGSLWSLLNFKISIPNPMNPNDTKKDLNPEIKNELEKSKLEVLTNENDFLVKNLKKAGWFPNN